MTVKETAAFLRQHDNYLILTHKRPDGDTIGCAAALCEGLRALGLAAPDTVELLYELRSRGIDIPLDAMTVEECADAICHAFSGEK